MKAKLLLVVFLILSFVTCTSKLEEIENCDDLGMAVQQRLPISADSMAYTSASELHQLYMDEPFDVIHFNIARFLAETELMAGANYALSPSVNPSDSWYLTPLPRVVYNYNNSPKYYEFGYVCNGQIVATVTTHARKEIDGVIAYLFAEPLDYSCPELDYYIGDYPNRYYGSEGVCYLKNCDEPLGYEMSESGTTDEEERDSMWWQMPEEDREAILLDMEEQDEDLDEFIAERDEYWETVDEYVNDILSQYLSDDSVFFEVDSLNLNFALGYEYCEPNSHNSVITQLLELLQYQVGYYDTGTLYEYSDPRLQITHWSGFCGPAACAWVYRGKYSDFNGFYLPLYSEGSIHNGTENEYFRDYIYSPYANDFYAEYNYSNSQLNNYHGNPLAEYLMISSSADNGLAACFYAETVPFWWNGWKFPLYHGGMNRGFATATNNQYKVTFTCKPYDWLIERNEPVIIAIDCSHYIVAFGYGTTRKSNGKVKDVYFSVTDNGFTTGPSYHPYMYRKSIWDLHYGLTPR